MKQTNNAIKFLMAQYRAIFKNAYFKGMATALVLTAGLAAGAAQAAEYYYYDKSQQTWVHTQNDSAATGFNTDGIIAGTIAGDALSGTGLDQEKASSTAADGRLVIGSGNNAKEGDNY